MRCSTSRQHHAREAICTGPDVRGVQDVEAAFYATTRALEIISEAARHLPEDVQARHSHLPWRSIRDAGNVYRHIYDDVEEAEVWRTDHSSLAPLLDAVSREIEALGE